MSIVDILLLAAVGVAVGFAIKHMIRNKSTCGCGGNCTNCMHNCKK